MRTLLERGGRARSGPDFAGTRVPWSWVDPTWAPIVLTALLIACGSDSPDLRLVGTIERTQVELVAPIGEVIVELAVERSQRVSGQQRILRLDPTLATADLASADAGIAMARSALSVAQEEERRAQQLRKDGVISQQALDRAVLTLDEARARLRESEARRRAAEKRLEDLTLTSPVSGVVDQLPFEVGERVPAGSVLAVLAADADPFVRVWIPERAVTQLTLGQRAEVRVDGLGRLDGRLVEIAREPEYTPHFALTERERAYLVFEARVQIERSPPSLRAGVPAEVVLVPERAMTSEGPDS